MGMGSQALRRICFTARRGASECAYEHYYCSMGPYSLDTIGYISIVVQMIGFIEYIRIFKFGFCGGPKIFKKFKRRVYSES